MPKLTDLLTCVCLRAHDCFLTQIHTDWESNVRKGKEEYEINCRDKEEGHRTGEVKDKVCGLCGFYCQSKI